MKKISISDWNNLRVYEGKSIDIYTTEGKRPTFPSSKLSICSDKSLHIEYNHRNNRVEINVPKKRVKKVNHKGETIYMAKFKTEISYLR